MTLSLKNLSQFLTLTLALCLLTACSQGVAESKTALVPGKAAERTAVPHRVEGDYFVAPDGSDAGPGSREEPFRTIQAAAKIAVPGQTVVIRGGDYRESVRPVHSGKAGEPIVYKAWPGETARILGTERLTNWRQGRNGFWSADCPRFETVNNQALQVILDGVMLPESRHPNQGEDAVRSPMLEADEIVKVEKVGHQKYRSTIRCEAWQEPKGSWNGAQISIRPMWEWGWGMQRTGTVIRCKPGELVIEMENYEYKNADGSLAQTRLRKGSPFFVFGGSKSLVDQTGEWIYDDRKQVLHLKAPKGFHPKTSVVEVKQRDWAFDLTDRSHITIEGLHLFGSSITTDTKVGTGIGELYPDKQVRHDIAASEHITLDGIRGRFLSHFTTLDGYVLSQWSNNTGIVLSGRRHTIKNSVLSYSAGNGVSLSGSHHKVINNIIHHIGYSGAECGAVTCGSWKTPSQNHEIAYNTMYTTGGNGTHIGGGSTDPEHPMHMHHNIIADVGHQRVDIGYMYTAGGPEVPDPDLQIRFNHNLMYSCTRSQGYGIYSDYGQGWLIDHNIVFDTPWAACVHVHDKLGHGNTWRNNTLIGWGHSLQGIVKAPARNMEVSNNILVGKIDQAKGVDFRNNLLADAPLNPDALLRNPSEFDFAVNVEAMNKVGRLAVTGLRGVGVGESESVGAEIADRYGSSLPPVVARPDGLKAVRTAAGVQLSWNDHADNEPGYILERGRILDPNFLLHSEWETLEELPANSASYTDTSAPAEGPVLYRVRAREALPSGIVWLN